jgi:hypothetical protein
MRRGGGEQDRQHDENEKAKKRVEDLRSRCVVGVNFGWHRGSGFPQEKKNGRRRQEKSERGEIIFASSAVALSALLRVMPQKRPACVAPTINHA